ncbi:hypothetical protein ANN_08263 [Periplaneta americana]|uniref:Uncharacterized protein n=1 Tax=Periplaneta americana TaxID=6978 RepID=A0ABQ8T0X2_PERAM|nr:hypothetical protein ANN_08263 [Periplaneta americana]
MRRQEQEYRVLRVAVASFRLTTGQDYLAKHLDTIGIRSDPFCMLCDSQEEIDRKHIARCMAGEYARHDLNGSASSVMIFAYSISTYNGQVRSRSQLAWSQVNEIAESRPLKSEKLKQPHNSGDQPRGRKSQYSSPIYEEICLWILVSMKDDDGNWNYNIIECEQQFSSRFPDYVITEYFRRNVINLVDKFRATGCTERKKSIRQPTKVTEDAVEDARERMQRSPNKSVKKLAIEIGVSYGSAHRILRKKLGMFPYKVSVVQELKPPDFTARLKYYH